MGFNWGEFRMNLPSRFCINTNKYWKILITKLLLLIKEKLMNLVHKYLYFHRIDIYIYIFFKKLICFS